MPYHDRSAIEEGALAGRLSRARAAGSAVNTAANETRPSLAWAATTLYFGRAPGLPITADIWVTTREQIGN